MTEEFLLSLSIGIAVMAAIFLGASLIFPSRLNRRAVAVFSAVCGLIVFIWLKDNPGQLTNYATKIALAGLSILILFLAFIRKRLH
jgi:Mn2+/Fe2+ NRAMP family transporter